MLLEKRHLYHPFSGSSLGFLVYEQSDDKKSVGFIIQDIDLYYQPVQEPRLASVFYIIRVFLLIIGWYINKKIWQMLNKENGLTKDVTKIYIIASMTGGSLWTLYNASSDFIHPLNELIGQWYCDLGWFFLYMSWFTMSFHSLIVAIMRYLFIVQEKKVEAYGKEKIRKMFYILSFLLPLLLMIWSIADKSDVDAMSFFNKCYETHHQVFLLDTSTLNVAKRNFCELVEYDENGSFGEMISRIRRYACIIRTVLILLMGFNFLEGLIYYKILTHIFR